MIETTTKLTKATNEVKDLVLEQACKPEVVMTMDPINLKLLQLSMQLVEAVNEYVEKSSEIISGVDRKLDEILKIAKGV